MQYISSRGVQQLTLRASLYCDGLTVYVPFWIYRWKICSQHAASTPNTIPQDKNNPWSRGDSGKRHNYGRWVHPCISSPRPTTRVNAAALCTRMMPSSRLVTTLPSTVFFVPVNLPLIELFEHSGYCEMHVKRKSRHDQGQLLIEPLKARDLGVQKCVLLCLYIAPSLNLSY